MAGLLVAFVFSISVLITGSIDSYAQESSFVLKVMNYNVKGLPVPWVKKKKRFKNIAKELISLRNQGQHPHVLNIQEAMSRKVKIIREAIKSPHSQKGPKGKWFRISAGLETFSEFEIVETNQMVYKRCASYDCLSRKGVLHTRIRVPGMPVDIDIYSTHMQAGPTGDIITPKWYTTMIRELQSLDYYAFVARTKGEKNIALHIGDFNFKPKTGLYPVFVDTLNLTNSILECANLGCAGDTDPYSTWENLIDHQFYNAPEGGPIVEFRPIYFDQLLKDPTGKVFSDHDATMVHYLITW